MNWLKSAIRKISNFIALDVDSRFLFLQALFLLPSVTISLNLFGLKGTQWCLTKLLSPQIKNQIDIEKRHIIIIKTITMVNIAVKFCQLWANCLKKSLVLWFLLRNQGIETELRIGVKLDEGNFDAHAWIEWQGYALNDTQDVRSRYATFERSIEVDGLFNK